MKTTLELPDDLMREVKIRAAREGRRIKDVMAELIRSGLTVSARADTRSVQSRVRLPLVRCAHSAEANDEMAPERVAQVLADDDVPGGARP